MEAEAGVGRVHTKVHHQELIVHKLFVILSPRVLKVVQIRSVASTTHRELQTRTLLITQFRPPLLTRLVNLPQLQSVKNRVNMDLRAISSPKANVLSSMGQRLVQL